MTAGAETIPGWALLLTDKREARVVKVNAALGQAGSWTWQVAVGVAGTITIIL